MEKCYPCPVGTYQDEEGKSLCKKCMKGNYTAHSGSYICSVCEINTYSSEEGFAKCINCPRDSNSEKGADTCVCNNGFYFNITSNQCESKNNFLFYERKIIYFKLITMFEIIL